MELVQKLLHRMGYACRQVSHAEACDHTGPAMRRLTLRAGWIGIACPVALLAAGSVDAVGQVPTPRPASDGAVTTPHDAHHQILRLQADRQRWEDRLTADFAVLTWRGRTAHVQVDYLVSIEWKPNQTLPAALAAARKVAKCILLDDAKIAALQHKDAGIWMERSAHLSSGTGGFDLSQQLLILQLRSDPGH